MYNYKAYGLNIRSDYSLPELVNAEKGKEDINIQFSTIKLPKLNPTSIYRQGIEAFFGGDVNQAYLYWSGIGKFLAKEGNTLLVEPASEQTDPQQLSLYTLSEALGLVLFQREYFLLHASAIKVNDRCIVIVGDPGAGKSTMAAAFAQKGHAVLSDDLVAITIDDANRVMVLPAYPQIKIWPESVTGLAYENASLSPLFSGSRKKVIRNRSNFPVMPCRLSSIFFLEKGAKLETTVMDKTQALLSLTGYFPCPSDLLKGAALEQQFQQCLKLLDNINILKLTRPQDFQALNEFINCAESQNRFTTTS